MQKKIKIGYVSLYYPPEGGGGELYAGRMIQALDNFDQYLWTATPAEKIEDGRFGEKCSIESFGASPVLDYATLADWFEKNREDIFQDIESWSRKTQCDLLVLNSPFTYFDRIKPFIDSLKGSQPVGSMLHDVPGKSFPVLLDEYQKTGSWEESLRKVRPRLLEFARSGRNGVPASPFTLGADFTIYNSEWVREFYDPNREQESFILHPLISRTHELPELGLAPVDLTIVNPLPMKGGALFLALANFHFRDLKIRILGGGYNSAMAKLEPFLHPVESGFYRAEIPANVEVLGHVQNMSEVYQKTRVLLHPTRIEGYGMTAAEALLENCVVVTTDIPGVIEGVGDAAVRMPYYATPQDWADSISSVLEGEHQLSEKISHRARFIQDRQAEEKAGVERFVETIVNRKG